ncbi:isochorismatase family protein [Corynebacterium freiburgense]|uniref:isochorismatase family protein n=1 Tax=Corynebacterium freiburgense TaxID=556548 RepID=UPI00047B09AC|nr:isochorismatase family protein [Corynebacterium freiburgense]WJZ01401.1 Streptothricin hydrolase [Corynebacterium freiburgense]
MSTALLIIDVQDSFRKIPSWEGISDPDIAAKIARLVDHARMKKHFIVWVLHADLGTRGPFDPANGLVQLQPGLVPKSGEPVITKTSHNAFTTTNLQQMLTFRGVDTIQVAGIRTEQCVETTARLASDLGYEVELIKDATATHPLTVRGRETPIPAMEVIDQTCNVLSGRFAKITTIAEVLAS